MPKPIIAVDMDEVLLPTRSLMIEYFNQVTDSNFSADDMTTGYFVDSLFNFDHDSFVKHLIDFTNHYHKPLPISGAVDALTKLKERYDLVIVTARQTELEKATYAYIEQHFPKIFHDIHFAVHISGKGASIKKSELSRKAGADIIIDDGLEHVTECAAAGMKAILFGDYAWNEADLLPDGVTRAKDWDEALKILMFEQSEN